MLWVTFIWTTLCTVTLKRPTFSSLLTVRLRLPTLVSPGDLLLRFLFCTFSSLDSFIPYSIKNRHLKHTMSRRNTSIGSCHWMAPEVVTNGIIDPAKSQAELDGKANDEEFQTGYDNHCDVWSLGKLHASSSKRPTAPTTKPFIGILSFTILPPLAVPYICAALFPLFTD